MTFPLICNLSRWNLPAATTRRERSQSQIFSREMPAKYLTSPTELSSAQIFLKIEMILGPNLYKLVFYLVFKPIITISGRIAGMGLFRIYTEISIQDFSCA